jgi:hypothetical protein
MQEVAVVGLDLAKNIDGPPLAFEQHRDPPAAVANPRPGDLFDPRLEGGWIGPLALVVIA